MSGCSEAVILEMREVSREIVHNGRKLKTVDAVTCRFNRGGIYNIVGPSGAGKSSLLRLLNRLDESTSGEIRFKEKPIQSYPPVELRRKVAMLFQTPYLFPGTILENLKYCRPDRGDFDFLDHLNRVSLKPEVAEKDAGDLSVGEKQRVALARSLMLEPEVILLDEPTSALDPTSSKKIEELILRLSRELSLTTITVTHSPEQALRLGGETLLLVGGRLIETGPTSEILTRPRTEMGQKYIDRELS
nr:ATP-binding cassette domain-containing protein [candidate division Zixibacteria bacterium]